MHAWGTGTDYYGNKFINPDADFWGQVKEMAQYTLRESEPFSVQGSKQYQSAGDNAFLSIAPYVGFGPAPAMITSPEVMDRFEHERDQQSYIKGLNRQLKQAIEKKDETEVHRLREEIRQERANEHATEREIKHDKARGKSAKAHELTDLFQGKTLHQAADTAEGSGYPMLAALLRALPERPKPRVAAALEGFA